jgi:methylmalonyl-CoA mutase
MPEVEEELASLRLSQDFPPVPTAAWEAAISKDLHGADYEKTLVWRTGEGLAVRPYYRAENLQGLAEQLRFPFVRGSGGSWEIAQDAAPAPSAIRADLLHEAGAHAVQELGYAIAAGVDRLAERVDAAAGEIEFVFAVGPSYFIEIAKLRAARLLWAQAISAFGATEGSRRMSLHARTPRRNKSVYDRYTNLLRVTTEAMAAVLGGCDRLTIEAFGFDPRQALNVQRILREETRLDAVADAAGGSYYVEALTDSLARAGWKLLQEVEAEGGYARALAAGSIGNALEQTRAARASAMSSRRHSLVGVNNYPNTHEKLPEVQLREVQLPAAESGPLPQSRLAEPFEKIRERTAVHALHTGRYPKVLLLKRGDAKLKGARAHFCLNFFGCAGFDIVETEELPNELQVAEAAGADLIVLCSADADYLEFAEEVCAQVKTPVLVAGNPKDIAGELRAFGVQGFVHSRCDMIETLTEWQDKLGISPLPGSAP